MFGQLIGALVFKLSHVHEFTLIDTTHVYQYSGDTLPYKTIKTYMCSCGRIRKVDIC